MTYDCPAWKFVAEIHLLELQRVQNKILVTISNFPRHTSVRDTHVLSMFHTFTITLQSYAEDEQKSFIIMKMKMYAILDKVKPHTENIKGLNLAAVIYTMVQVSILLP
jgi:hypothetical protein